VAWEGVPASFPGFHQDFISGNRSGNDAKAVQSAKTYSP